MAFAPDSAIAKAARAEAHLLDLKAELDRWIASSPYVLRTSVPMPSPTPRGTAEIEVRVLSVEPVPERVGVILGDVLSNLRAALDHVAWQLVCHRRRAEPPESQAKKVYFPIVKTPASFDSHITTRLVCPEAVGVLRNYQPFPENDTAASRHLKALKALSNTDKHRAIHTAVGSLLDEPGPQIVADGVRVLEQRRGERILVPNALCSRCPRAPGSPGAGTSSR